MSTREHAIKQAEIDYAYAVRRMSAVACRLHTLKQTVNQEETICTF